MTQAIGTWNRMRIPFIVSTREMSPDELSALADLIETTLGACYFRSKELLFSVIDDAKQLAEKPGSFLYGPFIGVVPNTKGDLRITSMNSASDHTGPGGMTVYAPDQAIKLLGFVGQEGVDRATLIRWPDVSQPLNPSPAVRERYRG